MSLVRLDRRDGVATITLDDAARRNAITLPMCDELEAVFDELEADDSIGAVVITGEDPAFCAGADLSHLGDSEEEGLLAIYEGFLRVGRCPLPTIAAVNGAAVGAGMNLALICDLRLAGRSARFDDRFLNLGIHPGGGHTYMLHNLCGPQTTAAAVLFGEILDGEQAERVGLAWRCVDDDALAAAAHELAARAATNPRELVVRTKATMAAVRTAATHDDAVRMELVPQVWSAQQPAFKEKLAALRAKISKRS
jgi:enoyl-CoA hydratase